MHPPPYQAHHKCSENTRGAVEHLRRYTASKNGLARASVLHISYFSLYVCLCVHCPGLSSCHDLASKHTETGLYLKSVHVESWRSCISTWKQLSFFIPGTPFSHDEWYLFNEYFGGGRTITTIIIPTARGFTVFFVVVFFRAFTYNNQFARCLRLIMLSDSHPPFGCHC